MALESIKYRNGKLNIIDQLLLPGETRYLAVNNVEDGWNVIHKMQVRGAPAIAIVGCLSLAIELSPIDFADKSSLYEKVKERLQYLISARPTAVNMRTAANLLLSLADQLNADIHVDVNTMKSRLISVIERMLEDDVSDNRFIGRYGAESILSHNEEGGGDVNQSNNICRATVDKVSILTHCNTGSLATAGYGTALGVIRALAEMDKLDHVYCTETRPYNQGSRLTAYELVHEKIQATLICDSAVSALMNSRKISAVVVGADRVTANGDTANKIGTYQIAVAAKYHNVPFYVAAPLTTIDLTLQTGKEIVIEERPSVEMTDFNGSRIAAKGISCWNPAFDVTPASLITGGIITNKGVFQPCQLAEKIKEFSSVC